MQGAVTGRVNRQTTERPQQPRTRATRPLNRTQYSDRGSKRNIPTAAANVAANVPSFHAWAGNLNSVFHCELGLPDSSTSSGGVRAHKSPESVKFVRVFVLQSTLGLHIQPGSCKCALQRQTRYRIHKRRRCFLSTLPFGRTALSQRSLAITTFGICIGIPYVVFLFLLGYKKRHTYIPTHRNLVTSQNQNSITLNLMLSSPPHESCAAII